MKTLTILALLCAACTNGCGILGGGTVADVVASLTAWIDFTRTLGQGYVDKGKVKQAELDAAVSALEAALSAWNASETGTAEDKAAARTKIRQTIMEVAILFIERVSKDGSVPEPPGPAE